LGRQGVERQLESGETAEEARRTDAAILWL
jgi:hypothetical protein